MAGLGLKYPNGHHNNIKTGNHPQSSTAIKRCGKYSCRNANETTETPTTTLEQISRRFANLAYKPHTKLLGAEPTRTSGWARDGNSPNTNSIISRPTNYTQHHRPRSRHHSTPTEITKSDRTTTHRSSCCTRRQELDTNSVCSRELKIHTTHHKTSYIWGTRGHHIRGNDDVPTGGQRPTDT